MIGLILLLLKRKRNIASLFIDDTPLLPPADVKALHPLIIRFCFGVKP